jgi:hypothetical protein
MVVRPITFGRNDIIMDLWLIGLLGSASRRGLAGFLFRPAVGTPLNSASSTKDLERSRPNLL